MTFRLTNKLKNKNLADLFFASFLPLLFTIIWLATNHQLPGNDASNYLMTAIDNYQYFVDKGWWSGAIHAYISRGWRPILFPNLGVLFLLISGGNLFFTFWAVALLCILASTIYIYLFLRIELNRFSAIVATNVVGLLPLIQAQLVMFYAEGALFFCLMGSLYHLIKSNYFCKKQHTIGFVILFSLALMLRPVEAATDFALVLTLFFIMGWKKQFFSIKQIAIVFSIIFFSALLFFTVASISYLSANIISVIDNGGPLDQKMEATLYYCFLGMLCGFLFTGFITFCIAKFEKSKNDSSTHIVSAFIGITLLVLLWFLPFATETFQWIYRTSMGDVANSTGSLHGSQFSWEVLEKYILAEGELVVLVVSGLAIFTISLLTDIQRKNILSSFAIIYLLLTIPFPLWEAFYTVQIVTRKLAFAFPAFLIAMLMIGLQKGRLYQARMSVITVLVLVQFAGLILLYSGLDSNYISISRRMFGNFIPQPSFIQPNPHDEVIAFLRVQAKKYNLHSIGLEVDPGTPDARHFVEAEPIDPFLLGTMIFASREQFYTNYPYFSLYSPTNISSMSKKFDGIFLSDSALNMMISSLSAEKYKQKYTEENSASLKTFYEFLMYFSENQLQTVGWKKVSCITIKTQKHGDYNGCLLLPSNV